MKKNILHGIIAGSLAAVAGITYQMVYENALFLDFSLVINPGSIAAASFFGTEVGIHPMAGDLGTQSDFLLFQ